MKEQTPLGMAISVVKGSDITELEHLRDKFINELKLK